MGAVQEAQEIYAEVEMATWNMGKGSQDELAGMRW